MADNYLEKKMEEHRSPQRPAYRQKLTPRGTKPGELLVKFHPCRIIIPDAATPLMQKLIGELTAIGFKVIFSLESARQGQLLAQSSGAQFSPAPIAPGEADITISANPADLQIAISNGKYEIKINLSDSDNPGASAVNTIVWSATQLANFNDIKEGMLKNIKIEGHIL